VIAVAKCHQFALRIAENIGVRITFLAACHPEQGRSPRRTFAVEALAQQAKAQGVSRSGIYKG
jgi:hypothetical protein